MPNATILYMTGTGNTRRAASVIAERLSAAEWGVNMMELRKAAEAPRGAFQDDLLVLSFPVLAFGMPALARTLLRGLRGQGRAAAIFATWGGDPLSAIWLSGRFLKQRGFRVVAAGGESYPFNWTQMVNPTGEPDASDMIHAGDAAASRFADELTAAMKDTASNGAMLRLKLPALSAVIGLPVSFIYSTMGRFGLAALFAADDRCKACGTCARDCPAASIVMAGKGKHRRPRWLTRCQGCNRCINLCPEAAIQSSVFRAAVHLTVNVALFAALVIGLHRLSALAALPPYLTVPAWIALFIAGFIYGSRLQFAALDPVLFSLESLPGLRRFLRRSWTASFRRYSCEGFAPQETKRIAKSRR